MKTNIKTVKQYKLIYSLTALVAFMCGAFIYLFFRNLNMVLFQFISKPPFLASFHVPVKAHTIWLSLFLFNLPDGLWFLSGLLVIRSIWLLNTKWRTIYCAVFCLIALLFEFGQLLKFIPGTFDPLDLLSMAFFAFVEGIIFTTFIRRKIEC
jgi:hypothetical protein